MSKENTSIHDFDFQIICEYFSGLERQGPGSPEITLKALSFIGSLSEQAQIADIGCGTGSHTRVLAQHVAGQITGIDLFPEFIALFNQHAIDLKLENRVKGIIGNMESLPFENESLDLIWSEGAIYNIGFERGLNEWKKFLKKDGHIAISEACWFTESRPAEIETFWLDAYPEIDTIGNKTVQLMNGGYKPIAIFTLPEHCWKENFYIPQKTLQEKFLSKYAGNATAEAFVANERREAELYEKYSYYYGYAFFIAQKI
jgi:SAM-dependent methyltransferase